MDCDLYAGIVGLELPVDRFDLGHGLTLRRTYAHVFAPYMAAFARAQPGKPHPAPWKAVSGGIAFDITTELCVPKDFAIEEWFDRVNTVWWVLALTRLKATTLATVPVVASAPFAEIPKMSSEPSFWPIEMSPRHLVPDRGRTSEIHLDALSWLRQHCFTGGRLMHAHEDFNVAFMAFDYSIWAGSTALGLLNLWGALESLFSPARAELCFRIPAAIATFLAPPGAARHTRYKEIKRLYDARSSAAHGRMDDPSDAFTKTYELLRDCLTAMLEQNSVPSKQELEARLFGANAH
jgi:hypothetical protein